VYKFKAFNQLKVLLLIIIILLSRNKVYENSGFNDRSGGSYTIGMA